MAALLLSRGCPTHSLVAPCRANRSPFWTSFAPRARISKVKIRKAMRALRACAAVATCATLALGAGCSGRRSAAEISVTPIEAAPAEDDRGLCADVADTRVCWIGTGEHPAGCEAAEGGGAICVSERPLPEGPPPTAGWRCYGEGEGRRCADRGLTSGPFLCEAGRCIQRYPRMPDDGEWECIDMDGAVMCRRGVPPAGVVTGPPDTGWICGERVIEERREQVCVDFSPDLPGGASHGWRCRYDHKRRERKICRETDRGAALGVRCESGAQCPDTLICVAGRCVPRAPEPVSCWFDEECGPGRMCHLGTCAGGKGT